MSNQMNSLVAAQALHDFPATTESQGTSLSLQVGIGPTGVTVGGGPGVTQTVTVTSPDTIGNAYETAQLKLQINCAQAIENMQTPTAASPLVLQTVGQTTARDPESFFGVRTTGDVALAKQAIITGAEAGRAKYEHDTGKIPQPPFSVWRLGHGTDAIPK